MTFWDRLIPWRLAREDARWRREALYARVAHLETDYESWRDTRHHDDRHDKRQDVALEQLAELLGCAINPQGALTALDGQTADFVTKQTFLAVLDHLGLEYESRPLYPEPPSVATKRLRCVTVWRKEASACGQPDRRLSMTQLAKSLRDRCRWDHHDVACACELQQAADMIALLVTTRTPPRGKAAKLTPEDLNP